MTVQELIDELLLIEDKSKKAKFQDSEWIGGEECESVVEKPDKVILCW